MSPRKIGIAMLVFVALIVAAGIFLGGTGIDLRALKTPRMTKVGNQAPQ